MNPELNRDHLPLEHFIECLRWLHENLYQVTLTGGEPMTFRDDLLRIAEEARKLDVPMVTVTAGTLLTEKFLRRYGAEVRVPRWERLVPRQRPESRGRGDRCRAQRIRGAERGPP